MAGAIEFQMVREIERATVPVPASKSVNLRLERLRPFFNWVLPPVTVPACQQLIGPEPDVARTLHG
jgi:hypothetical protein